MSKFTIMELIEQHVASGLLYEFRPIHLPQGYRKLFLTPALYEYVFDDDGSSTEAINSAELMANFNDLVSEYEVIPSLFFGLSPRSCGVWEIRSSAPTPEIRVFTLIATKDVFVSTHMEFRDYLGDGDSREWSDAIRSAQTKWRQLFPGFNFLTSGRPRELFSGAVDDDYYK